MSTLSQEVYEAFRELGVPEEKAMKAATALSKRDADVTEVKRDVAVVKWMLGFNTTLVAAIFLKQFFA